MEKIIYGLLLCVIGVLAAILITYCGNKYYAKRFSQQLMASKKGYILPVLVCVAGAIIYTWYGYIPVIAVSYEILMAALVLIARIDKAEKVIPNVILLILLGVRILTLIVLLTQSIDYVIMTLVKSVAGIVFGSVIFLVARIISKESMGMGDVKLFALLGFYLGSDRILWVILASLLMSMCCNVYRLAKKTISMKDTISFGPYIALGCIAVLFLGI